MSLQKPSKFRKIGFKTVSGIPLKPCYFPAYGPCEKAESPGQYPYTRGIHSHLYLSQLWTMRQYAGFASAEESNERYRYLLSQGTTGLSVAFDLPTQIGYDSDSPHSVGEVGKVGVAIDTLADMETLFDKIPLDSISTSMTINASASVLLCLYIAVAEKQGVSATKLKGTIQNDILKEYVARGTYIFPPQPSMRLITDIFSYCQKELPLWNTISISGYHIREAGSTAAQEVGFTLANAIAYVDAAIKVGLKVDDFAPRLSFFFNSFTDIFEEVSKFRAARRLWAKIMRERFKATAEKSLMLRFHTQTAGSTLTAQQPDNNVVRVTLQALAAVLGGTQSLHTNGKDEALSLPTQHAATLALRTQQIIAYESGAADVVDPLGGSYFIEELTEQIEKEALQIITRIDELGGAVAAIEQGFMQSAIQQSAYDYEKDIQEGKRIIVGVNHFQSEELVTHEILRVDPVIEAAQIRKLHQVKANRSDHTVREALTALKVAAQGQDNLMPHILKAVRGYASLGEICQVLRDVFGEYKEKIIL